MNRQEDLDKIIKAMEEFYNEDENPYDNAMRQNEDFHNLLSANPVLSWLAIICVRTMKHYGYTKSEFIRHAKRGLHYYDYNKKLLDYLWDNKDVYYPYSNIKIYEKERKTLR